LTSTTQLIGTGTTTNNDASAGQVGEYVSSTVTGLSLNSTASNNTSISLTAGDWDVRMVLPSGGTGAGCTAVLLSINTTSATVGSQAVDYIWVTADTVNGLTGGSFIKRISLASTTTVYSISRTVAGTCTSSAVTLSARRVR
jgi:hypothetical protein